jgi:hypothetical protein
VLPHDHEGISAGDGVIRRISELQIVLDKSGGRRLSSMAFKASAGENGGMSVDLEALIVEAGEDPRRYVTTPRWTGSVRFEADRLREEKFSVGYDPLPDNPCHGEVWGAFTKSQQRNLRRMATWFVKIPGVMISAD